MAQRQPARACPENAGPGPLQNKIASRPAAGRAPARRAAQSLPTRCHEQRLWDRGFKLVAGVDEAGRGPLAGPVVAAACIIPPHVHIEGVTDSKKMSEAQREAAFAALMEHPEVACATHVVDAAQIDELNILQATLLAITQAVRSLPGPPAQFCLIDGNQQPQGLDADRCELVVRGDSTSHVIAAASILAKVTRDRLMVAYDAQFPAYQFARHKGYGTAAHLAALRQHGPCPIHRRSYAPVALAEQRLQQASQH